MPLRKTFRRWKGLIAAVLLVGVSIVAVQILVISLQKRAGSMQTEKEAAAKALLGR
jgi:hypothetical protein